MENQSNKVLEEIIDFLKINGSIEEKIDPNQSENKKCDSDSDDKKETSLMKKMFDEMEKLYKFNHYQELYENEEKISEFLNSDKSKKEMSAIITLLMDHTEIYDINSIIQFIYLCLFYFRDNGQLMNYHINLYQIINSDKKIIEKNIYQIDIDKKFKIQISEILDADGHETYYSIGKLCYPNNFKIHHKCYYCEINDKSFLLPAWDVRFIDMITDKNYKFDPFEVFEIFKKLYNESKKHASSILLGKK